jgi:hypothetical protein
LQSNSSDCVGLSEFSVFLRDPDVIHLIRIQARVLFFLAPIMTQATGYQLGKPLAQFFQEITEFLDHP